MRDAILDAVHSGKIEDLRPAVELNELKPDFGAAAGVDPIGALKAQSKDGTGADLLAILGALLDSTPASERSGRDAENNRIYVWPAFSLSGVTTANAEEAQLLDRIASAADAAAMRKTGLYTGWQLRIGADGVWHSFKRAR